MNIEPTPTDILNERLSDIALTQAREAEHAAKLGPILELARIAIPAVLNAAAAGNVTCLEAVKQMTPYLLKEVRP